MEKNNGDQPAFARPYSDRKNLNDDDYKSAWAQNGLTKREYFAAMADVPWEAVINILMEKGKTRQEITVADVINYRAILKVIESDRLLAELSKKEETQNKEA